MILPSTSQWWQPVSGLLFWWKKMWPWQPFLTWQESSLVVKLSWPNLVMTDSNHGLWLEWRDWGLSTHHSCGNWSISSFLSKRDSIDCLLEPLPHAPCATKTWMRTWSMPSCLVTTTKELVMHLPRFSPNTCQASQWWRSWAWSLENFLKNYNSHWFGSLLLSSLLCGRGDQEIKGSVAMKSELK